MQNNDLPEIPQRGPAAGPLPAGPAPRLLTRTGRFLLSVIDLPFRFIFGPDVFVSYSRRDSRKYAPNLTLALQKRMPKLSVYLDRWIAPPSGKLPLSLRLQLRWSSILVVVCTEKAVRSDFVKDEVAKFARLGRKVVTVDVDGAYSAVRGEMPWLEVSGADPEEETRKAVESGTPSDNVIERILKCVEFTTQARRLRRAIVGTLVFVGLSVGGTALYSNFVINTADAKAALAESRAAEASKKADAAEAKAASAEQRESAAIQREAVAKKAEEAAVVKQNVAEGRAREASLKAATAEGLRVVAETKAAEARVEAEKQQGIAVARRLAAESNLAENPHLEEIEKKTLLNVESMLRSPSAVAYRNLIEAIKMIPRPHETVSHDGEVNALTFSPDGALMAAAAENALWLRKAGGLQNSGKLGEPLKIQHPGRIVRVEFSSDGKYLATLSRDAGVRIWRLDGMQELPSIPLKSGRAIAFSRDGRHLAIGGSAINSETAELKKTASVWELGPSAREVAAVETKGTVIDVTFDAEGKLFTTLSEENEDSPVINFWHTSGGMQRKPVAISVVSKSGALRGGFTPSGKQVAVVHQDDRQGATVLNAKDGKKLFDEGQLELVQFSPDGRFLVTATADDESDHRRTSIWDITGERLQELRHINYRSIIREGAFSRDGKYLALVSQLDSVQVWDTVAGRVVAFIKLKQRRPQIAFTADGRFLALSAGSDVTLWPIAADWKSSETEHAGEASALSPDGKTIAVAHGTTVQLINATDGSKVSSLDTPCDVGAVAFDWKGERVATAGLRCGVWVWDLGGGKPGTPIQPKGPSDWIGVDDLAFSRDGRFLAAIDDQAHVVEIADPSNHTLFPATDQVLSVAFSADGERLVTAYQNGLDIWQRRAPNLKPKHLTYHLLKSDSNEPVVSFGEDGYLTVADDYEAHIWDVTAEPTEIGMIELQDVSSSAVYHSMLSPGGAFVASMHFNRIARPVTGITAVWHLQPSAVLANTCTRLSRPLSQQEWEKALGKETYRQTCGADRTTNSFESLQILSLLR